MVSSGDLVRMPLALSMALDVTEVSIINLLSVLSGVDMGLCQMIFLASMKIIFINI